MKRGTPEISKKGKSRYIQNRRASSSHSRNEATPKISTKATLATCEKKAPQETQRGRPALEISRRDASSRAQEGGGGILAMFKKGKHRVQDSRGGHPVAKEGLGSSKHSSQEGSPRSPNRKEGILENSRWESICKKEGTRPQERHSQEGDRKMPKVAENAAGDRDLSKVTETCRR